jgi:hypothetical protein
MSELALPYYVFTRALFCGFAIINWITPDIRHFISVVGLEKPGFTSIGVLICTTMGLMGLFGGLISYYDDSMQYTRVLVEQFGRGDKISQYALTIRKIMTAGFTL